MANEIIALEASNAGNEITLLMLFPVATPKQVNGSNVVPTPSSDLTTLEDSLLSAGQQSALDAGTGVFRRVSMPINADDDGPSLIAKAQALYTTEQAKTLRAYNYRYRFIGSKLDAPA